MSATQLSALVEKLGPHVARGGLAAGENAGRPCGVGTRNRLGPCMPGSNLSRTQRGADRKGFGRPGRAGAARVPARSGVRSWIIRLPVCGLGRRAGSAADKRTFVRAARVDRGGCAADARLDGRHNVRTRSRPRRGACHRTRARLRRVRAELELQRPRPTPVHVRLHSLAARRHAQPRESTAQHASDRAPVRAPPWGRAMCRNTR